MIYTVLPTGSFHGWGVCGKYIVKELSKLTEIKLITDNLSFENILDELDFRLLRSKLISDREQENIKNGSLNYVGYPVLHGIPGNSLQPIIPNFRGENNVGYVFFEDNVLPQNCIENGKRYFDTVVTGSSWNETILRGYGLKNIKTIIQGIDPSIFNPWHSDKEYLEDTFVIFSGGKFEYRKGQDIVIKAYKVLQDRHKDVLLINSWFNQWAFSFQTMSASPYITFSPSTGDYFTIMNNIFQTNGIDTDRVITLPPYPNIMMPRIYKNTDIGLFPNRCEGGTNLVLMEYMGCRKPVLASYNTGHKDILTETNSVPINTMRPVTFQTDNTVRAVWEEPDLDETIQKLEWAYSHRENLQPIAEQAGKDLSKLTWGKTARSFYELLTS
jgi:glycosyltransferase involved in cell wall biosynthesis